MWRKGVIIIAVASLFSLEALTQEVHTINDLRYYEVEEVRVVGYEFLSEYAIIAISGIQAGDHVRVRDPKFSLAIKKLWAEGLFEDITIRAFPLSENKLLLEIVVLERPRIAKIPFKGISNSQKNELEKRIRSLKGKILTDAIVKNTVTTIKKYFAEKGYLNAEVKTQKIQDPLLKNRVNLNFIIDKKKRVKVKRIEFTGNYYRKDQRLKKLLNSQEKSRISLSRGVKLNIFRNSKYLAENYKEDKRILMNYYHSQGYRDAQIVEDTIIFYNSRQVILKIELDEGPRYVIREISWLGNSKYGQEFLTRRLGVKTGDFYNLELINRGLYQDKQGRDISSLYMDDGYLQFSANPVDLRVKDDSIDLEIRIHEGPQYTIGKINIEGNDLTSDQVIRRELRTLPGQKFNRSEVTRSLRELAGLGYFNPQSLDVKPHINFREVTVDLTYQVEEQSSDQFEMSGGWGGSLGFVGSVGFSFNNFSLRNLIAGKNWRPLPMGDGQKLAIRAQSSGREYNGYSFSFSEPWLGGKKPNTLFSSFSMATNRDFDEESDEQISSIKQKSLTLGLAKPLTWPDDYFSLSNSITFSRYDLDNYGNSLGISEGASNSISFKTVISRNSLDFPYFPTSGSSVSLGVSFTPPYSLFNGIDYNTATNEEKYRFAEFHQWQFDASHYFQLVKNLVFTTRLGVGLIRFYSKETGASPFNRFYLGGSGLSGSGDFLLGAQIIGLRGYDDQSIVPNDPISGIDGGVVYHKVGAEIRYRLSKSPLIYILGFAEGANTWNNYQDVQPFNLFKSAGIGLRINLPMIGMIGLDWGYALDNEIVGINPAKQKITFVFGNSAR